MHLPIIITKKRTVQLENAFENTASELWFETVKF
jgi:hypothetical protein